MSIYLYSLLLCVASLSSVAVPATNNPLPPSPNIPCNVTKVGLPKTSSSLVYQNNIQDYVALRVMCTQGTPTMTYRITCYGSAAPGGISQTNNSDELMFNNHVIASTCYSSAYCLGFRDPLGYVYTVYDFVCKSNGYEAGDLLVNPKYYSRVVSGSFVKEIDVWSLVEHDNIPANQPYTMTYTGYAGLERLNAPDLSDAVGVTTATPYNSNFDAYCSQMTTRLTSVFGHSVNITSEALVDYEMYFPPTTTEQVVGIYKLKQTFMHVMSYAWVSAVSNQNTKNQAMCASNQCNCVLLFDTSFMDYYDDMFLGVSGVDRPC